MAKAAKAAKAKPESGSGSSLVWVQGLACGGMAALAPMTMAQVGLLLAPALLALMMDKRPGKPVARVMLLFALAASVEPIRVAWATGTGPTLDRVLDPTPAMGAWLAAALGWLLAQVVPLFVGAVVDAAHRSRSEQLRATRVDLVRTWGLEDLPPGDDASGT